MTSLPLILASLCPLLAPDDSPRSVAALWADFDPRKDPLETEIIREWHENGLTLRAVRFLVGTFKGKAARVTAFYGLPQGNKGKLPAVMHIHGGGQRADLDEVKLLAARDYAALSINWGGREMEAARPGDPPTDWGAVDPTQQNVPGYFSMLPGPKQFFEDREHPKNCNWYLLTLACRRGLTFLEQQPEVDGNRLGIHGYSMGGNLTMYVAGSDTRVKAAVPAVGGAGWRWQVHKFNGGTSLQDSIKGDLDIFRSTLSFESYAANIHCPLLHRSATNDFHGWMDDVYRTDALIPNQPVRHAFSPHFNHRLTSEVAVTMPLWFDHCLKPSCDFPDTPSSELILTRTPKFRVTPLSPWPISRCEIYYSVDADPRNRFWRSAEVKREGNVFTANVPPQSLDLPLFAFANVFYTLPKPVSMKELPAFRNREIHEVCLSTTLHSANGVELKAANIDVNSRTESLVDNFTNGWRDWYILNDGNRDHQQNWTRKLTDPRWRGPENARLAITLTLAESNSLTFVIVTNEWRSYRGPKQTFAFETQLKGAPREQTIELKLTDFVDTSTGAPLTSWRDVDLFGFGPNSQAMASQKVAKQPTPPWRGPAPTFSRLFWK